MRFAVAVGPLALPAGRAEHVAVQIELDDFPRVAVREHDVLLVTTHAQAARRARVPALAEKPAVAVEHLDALV